MAKPWKLILHKRITHSPWGKGLFAKICYAAEESEFLYFDSVGLFNILQNVLAYAGPYLDIILP